jgi:hypothetical protein
MSYDVGRPLWLGSRTSDFSMLVLAFDDGTELCLDMFRK